MPSCLPESVAFVVVGAGVHGLSTAYHLAEELSSRGRSGQEVVVLEKERVGAGASGVCCGIVRNLYLSPAMNELVARSVRIFGLDPAGFGYHGVGYVAAVAAEQVPDLERIGEQHREIGYASELVRGAGTAELHMQTIFPDWDGNGVAAVLHERQGGWADPMRTLENLAGMARSLGVRILEGVEVEGFEVHDGLVQRVETTAGPIECDLVVVAPGPWAPELWRMLELPDKVEVERDGERSLRPMFVYWKLLEGDYFLPGSEHLAAAGGEAPVVHVDSYDPLLSDRDARVVHPGPWGIYFKPGRHGGVQGGGLPVVVGEDVDLEPYGPTHPEHGPAGPEFDEYFVSGLATVLRRFRNRSRDWRCDSRGGLGAFTPDHYPVVDFVRANAYAILDSNHGFKLLALGELAAADVLTGSAPALEEFRLARFEQGALHPVSHSPYPWN